MFSSPIPFKTSELMSLFSHDKTYSKKSCLHKPKCIQVQINRHTNNTFRVYMIFVINI